MLAALRACADVYPALVFVDGLQIRGNRSLDHWGSAAIAFWGSNATWATWGSAA